MMQVHSRLETRHGPQSLVLSSILPASGASVLASETPLEIEPAGNRRGGRPPMSMCGLMWQDVKGPKGGAPPNVNVCATLC